MMNVTDSARRNTIKHLLSVPIAAVVAATGLRPAQAGLLVPTPMQSRGPFYPTEYPADTDNDLLKIGESAGLAQGRAVRLSGKIVDRAGRSPREAVVEIWQCDAQGRYRHPWDRRSTPLDTAFQGYGRYRVGADGNYWFRTIKPVPYPGRTPHIHFLIRGPGFEPLVTQMYVHGEADNDRDGLLNSIRDPQRRAQLIVDLKSIAGSVELHGRFDIIIDAVLGV